MSKMKSGSKKKFLLCFRPVVDVEFVFEFNEDDDQINNKNKKKKNRGLIAKSSSSSDVNNNKETRNFSQIVKAVLFETILAKRIRKRKSLKRSVSADDEFQGSPIFSSSSSISSTTSSSCSSSNSEINLSPTVKTDTKQQQEVHKTGKSCKSSLNGGILSLLMIILGLTVLCGKFYGIVLTAIWVYFVVPICRKRDGDEVKTENCEMLSRAEYIKKVKKVGSKDRSRGSCFSCLMPSESIQLDRRNYSNRLLVN